MLRELRAAKRLPLPCPRPDTQRTPALLTVQSKQYVGGAAAELVLQLCRSAVWTSSSLQSVTLMYIILDHLPRRDELSGPDRCVGGQNAQDGHTASFQRPCIMLSAGTSG
jgi:hypothetical protein